MTTLKVNVIRKPTIKVKVLPNFPSSVTSASPILLNRTGGNYAFSMDISALLLSLPPSASIDTTNASNISSGTLAAARLPSVVRQKLLTNADYYVRRDGNDSNTGLANTAGGAWLTIQHALTAISNGIDFAGLNVVVHVQGANVGDGTYTENIILPDWVGYTGNGFGQFIILAENGIATITGTTATATILSVGTSAPIQFKNFVIANANAAGVSVEGDDGGFVALHTITFGSTGAGGILALTTQSAGRILFLASTFTIKSGLTTGTGFLGRSGGEIIFQPGVTINFAGASTFSNAVADFATMAFFDDTGSTWSGTVPTGKPYVLDKDSGARIVDVSLIPGSLGPTLIPLQVGSGGTGAITSTGSGAVVLAASPTFTGTTNFGTGGIIAAGDIVSTKTSGILSETLTASAAGVQISYTGAGGPAWFLKDSSAGADLKFFLMSIVSGTFAIKSLTDVGGAKATFITFDSSTGITTVAGVLAGSSSILSTSPTAGMGYATGAGGTVTQLTSRTTGVTLNKVSGAITLFAAAPAVGTWVSFTVTNSAVAATDTIILSVKSSNGANTYIAHVTLVAASSFQISFTTIVGTTSDSPVINFNVIKGVAA